ncbi:MAG: hypothetical protein KJO31_05955, partial [Gammaproteobacteria bacterium]|nr:hypothetical protein [Gammaproteobacteria bacterium]
MFGHTMLVGSILAGERGFDWVATVLEELYIAQPTVVVISALFLLHAAFASRKIPAQLADRRRMISLSNDLARAGHKRPSAATELSPLQSHVESVLWIWQVRTGMVILVLGSFHLILIALDVLTPLFGERVGIEATTTLERERAGLWILYAILTVCVAFHTATGLYRLAVKWGVGARFKRETLRWIEHIILWFMLAAGTVTLLVMAGVLPPPLAGLMDSGS